MPPVPKKKHTRSRSGAGRNYPKFSIPTLGKCPSCGKLKLPHKACPFCGFYGEAGYSGKAGHSRDSK